MVGAMLVLLGSTISAGGGAFSTTITANQTDLNLRTYALGAGWDGSSPVEITINSGVSVTSSSTGTPALTVDGSWPGGVTLINNGTIAGKGGTGSGGAYWMAASSCTYVNAQPSAAGSGGTALAVSTALTLDNQGTIGGGGGGGGAGTPYYITAPPGACGNPAPGFGFQAAGSGGGGAGFGAGAAYNRYRADSAEASDCTSCCTGFGNQRSASSGSAGSLTAGGAAGARAAAISGYCFNNLDGAGDGGAGGSLGASGSNGTLRSGNGGYSPTVGGAGGNAITGNSNITYISTGSRLGGIS